MQGPYAHNILAYLTYFNIWEYHSCFSPHFRWLFFFGAGWILWSPPLGPTSTTMRPFSPSTGRVGTTPGLATWIRWARWERWEDPFFLGFTKRQIFFQRLTTSYNFYNHPISNLESRWLQSYRTCQVWTIKATTSISPLRCMHPSSTSLVFHLPSAVTTMLGELRSSTHPDVWFQEAYGCWKAGTTQFEKTSDLSFADFIRFSFPSPALVEETKAALTCSCPPYPSGHGSSRFMTQLHIHRLSGHWVIFGIQHLFIFWVGSLFIG